MLRYNQSAFALCMPLFLYALPLQASIQNQSADVEPSLSGQRIGLPAVLKMGSPNGKTLQSVFAIPHELTRQHAQQLLTLWTELKSELTDIGVSSAELNLTTRTLLNYSKMPDSSTTFTLDIRNNNHTTFQENGTK